MEKSFKIEKSLVKQILHIGLTIIIQQILLTSFGLVDSIMVGSIEYAISAVGVAAQIEAIMMTVGFGVNTGICIFIAQFFGKKDNERIKKAFSLMLIINIFNGLIFTILALLYTENIIAFFNSNPQVVTLGSQYLRYAAISYVFTSINYAYSFVYRNIQRTKITMYNSIISMLINVVFNYLLIYGIGIFPNMGVAGAGFATMMSTFIGVIFNVGYALKTKQIFNPKWEHFKESLNPKFFSPILYRSVFFIFNEALFSIGSVLYVRFLNSNSHIDPNPYEGYRIAEILVSFMFSITIALSSAATAILGQELGAKQYDKAKSYGNQIMFLGIFVAIFIAILNSALASPLVSLFNKNAAITTAAISVLHVFSLRLFLRVFSALIFSTLRAGGKSHLVIILDAGIMWVVGIPLAFIATTLWHVNNIAILYLIIQAEAVVRVIVGIALFLRYTWIKNVEEEVKA